MEINGREAKSREEPQVQVLARAVKDSEWRDIFSEQNLTHRSSSFKDRQGDEDIPILRDWIEYAYFPNLVVNKLQVKPVHGTPSSKQAYLLQSRNSTWFLSAKSWRFLRNSFYTKDSMAPNVSLPA